MLGRHPLVERLIGCLERLAPLELADHSFDNVGLLYEASHGQLTDRMKVMVTTDLTEAVFCEAARNKVDFVVAYHPPWFGAAKRLTMDRQSPHRVIALCASAGISVYSPHTALDAVENGINDWIVDRVAPGSARVPLSVGRIAVPGPDGVSIGQILASLAKALGLSHLRVAFAPGHTRDTRARRLAVCAGSGGSVLANAEADVYISGEMGHHQLLRANHQFNATVVLTEHSSSERPFLRDHFTPQLSRHLNDGPNPVYVVLFSQQDREPIEIEMVSVGANDVS